MPDEIKLLHMAMNGDANAFEKIVIHYQSLVCAITFSGTGQVDISEELAQETFLSAWKNLRQLKDPGGFKAWLCTIARNLLNNYYRSKKAISVDPAELDEFSDPSPAVSDNMIHEEEQTMLQQTLMQLPQEYREPLVMFYRQGQSSKEVAAALGLNESTVRTRLQRARLMLREEVAARLEQTLQQTVPGKKFTKSVMVALGAAGIGLSGTGTEAAAATIETTNSITAKITSVISSTAAKITAITAIGIVAVGSITFIAKTGTQLDNENPAAAQAILKEAESDPFMIRNAAGVQETSNIYRQMTPAGTNAQPSETTFHNKSTIQCSGYVVNSENAAVPDVHLILYHYVSNARIDNYIQEETTSDGSGVFRFESALNFERAQNHSYGNDHYIILAVHPDYAWGWLNLRQGDNSRECRLVLTEPVTKKITVTDRDGNPLAGASVWPYIIGDRNDANPLFHDRFFLDENIHRLTFLTDVQGRVEFMNLPKTDCSFHAWLKGYATGTVFPGGQHIRLSPGACVRGRIITIDNKPVGDAVVKFSPQGWSNAFISKTDEQGYYSLENLPAKGLDMSPWGEEPFHGIYNITVHHDRFSAQAESFQLLPEDDIPDLDIIAYEDGTLVKCRVISKKSKIVLAGARIQGSNNSGRIDGFSDDEGIFTFQAEPGPTSLFLSSPPDGVYITDDAGTMRIPIRFDAAGREMEVTLEVPEIGGALVSLSGKVLGPDGLPYPNAVIYAEADKRFSTSTATGYIRSTGTDSTGTFKLKEVPGGMKLFIYAESKDGRLAGTGVFEIPSNPDVAGSMDIFLENTQTSNIIIRDSNHQPLKNTDFRITPFIAGHRVWGGYSRIVRTDAEGILRANTLLHGLEYQLQDYRIQKYMNENKSIDGLFDGRMVLITTYNSLE